MTDYPHTRAFIAELCGLDEVDAQLPLPVLINLHRMRVWGAFNILPYVGARAHGWDRYSLLSTVSRVIDKRYPALAGGRIFEGNGELSLQRSMWGPRFERLALPTVLATGNSAHEWLLVEQYYDILGKGSTQRSRSWDPALQLYAIVDEGTRQIALPQLELQLALDPTVGQMLLWLADVSRVEVEALTPKRWRPLRYTPVEARALLQSHLHPSRRDPVGEVVAAHS